MGGPWRLSDKDMAIAWAHAIAAVVCARRGLEISRAVERAGSDHKQARQDASWARIPRALRTEGRSSLDVRRPLRESVVVRRSSKEGRGTMPAMAVPLAADKLDAWEAWLA